MAAGLGFKDFVTGEVLTAADVDGYLMQGVWVFASAAARDAAVTSPQEGNFAYLKDTNVTTYYTGSAWTNLVPAGASPANSTDYVATSQNTTSTSYTDLGTVVSTTLTTGTKALVIHGARFYNSTADAEAQQSFAVSGATTVAADVKNSVYNASKSVPTFLAYSRGVLLTGLTAGSNTFTLKYKVDSGTGIFMERQIVVIDMGS